MPKKAKDRGNHRWLAVARWLIVFFCLLDGFGALLYLAVPFEMMKQLYPADMDRPDMNLSSYFWLVSLLNASIVGIYGAYTRNPLALKIFAMTVSIFVLKSATTSYYEYKDHKVGSYIPKSGITMRRNVKSITWTQTTRYLDNIEVLTKCCGQERLQWIQMIPDLIIEGIHPLACCPTQSRSFLSNDSCHFDADFIAECQADYGKPLGKIMTYLLVDMFIKSSMIVSALSIAKSRQALSNFARLHQYARFWGLSL